MQRIRQLNYILSVVLIALNFSFSSAQTGDNVAGEKSFKTHCASCHKLDKEFIGPALNGVTEKYEAAWLHQWITNNKALIESGDAQAIELSKLKPSEMTIFEGTLATADIDNILAYIQSPPVKEVAPVAATTTENNGAGDKSMLRVVLLALIVLLFVLLVLLAKVYSLVKVLKSKEGLDELSSEEEGVSFIDKITAFLSKNQWVTVLLGLLLVFGGLKTKWDLLTGIDMNKGYAPVQPIDFSHRIHAGVNKIDCQYCHSSAKSSKTSGIPSLNVCMNCHKGISEYTGENGAATAEEKKYYTGEIQKIYKHIGWDPNKMEYTGEQTPIEWVRIHNLQDFVYFNHSQHVTAGKQECQTCHGEVEEMDVLEQYAPLTMGWCVNCHRDTEIQIESNGYYEGLHDKLKDKGYLKESALGENGKPTVQLIGGMECGKCHY